MEQEQLKNTIEALLFVSSKPLKVKDFVKMLEINEQAVKTALDELYNLKKDNGITLLESNGEYQLTTNSQYSTQIKNFLNTELREKLTDATVEVLAIIAYRQPISKAEIEAIRGVSSQYSLRNLLIRGMIEKVSNPGDARSVLYQTTTEFLMHLGLNSTKDLPEFDKLVEHIKLPETPALTQKETVDQLEVAQEPSVPEKEIAPIAEIEQALGTPLTELAETKENSSPEEQDEAELEDEEEDEDDDDE